MVDQSAVGRVFHALGDPTRRAIVDQLCRAPRSAKDLAEPLHITLAAVVQHLQMLEESGLIRTTKVGRVFHALGDPTRRAIVDQLCRAPRSAKDLAEPLHITLAAVVQHLQTLEESGLIRTTKVGRVRMCRIEPAGLQVAQMWIAKRRSLWERRLDRLGAVLARARK